MLLKNNISNIRIHSDEWYAGRLAKFTASEIHSIMGEKFETTGAINYIYRKVGEEMTGVACKDEVDTSATRHGLLYEPEAIKKFGDLKGLEFVVTQCLITQPESRFGCTPDLIIPVSYSKAKKSYDVITGEVKCPVSYDAYIGLFLCNTPQDVKKEEKKYYWQVLDQMDNCDCLRGYLIVYHPLFKAGQMKIIEFRKVELVNDFKLLKERKQMALAKFNEIRAKLLSS